MGSFLMGKIVGTRYFVRFAESGKIKSKRFNALKGPDGAELFARRKALAFIVKETVYTQGFKRICREVPL